MLADGLEQLRGGAGDRDDGLARPLPGGRDEGWRSEVVELVGAHCRERAHDTFRFEQVALDQVHPAAQVLRGAEPALRRPHHSHHFIVLLEQQLRKERAILARQAG